MLHFLCIKKIIIDSFVFLAANQHITMISEGLCDTADWSNDAENSAYITGIHFKNVKNTFVCTVQLYYCKITFSVYIKKYAQIKHFKL